MGLRGAHVQKLRGVVPLVEGFSLLQTVVALQAQQLALHGFGQGLGQLRLAHARFAFQKQRPLQLERQKNRCSEAPIGKIAALTQRVNQGVDGGEEVHGVHQ